ncbi:hypothetical protein CVT24_012207 [Panaeolus cyanescens]|uniref:Lysine-specific metallo-endopeptidase domain-containing protein n=1 Tax=Panaeolus cyanescens TaxID=181874 RepID=A0A409X7E4_9AGAR|nr:hypothetical protein CVT24_012207 [Panaeolus cyanescens]
MEADYATLKDRFVKSQKLLVNLKRMFKIKDFKRTAILKYAWGLVPAGDDVNIEQRISILADPQKYVTIGDVKEAKNENNQHVYAYVTDGRMYFTANFYDLPKDDQVGTIIHEAAHLFLDCYDHFLLKPPHTPTFEPDQEGVAYKGPAVMTGYESEGFHTLTDNAPHFTKYNADSYAVAAIMAWRIKDLTTEKEIEQALFSKHAFSSTRFGQDLHVHAGPSGSKSKSGSPKSDSGSGKSKGKGRRK